MQQPCSNRQQLCFLLLTKHFGNVWNYPLCLRSHVSVQVNGAGRALIVTEGTKHYKNAGLSEVGISVLKLGWSNSV